MDACMFPYTEGRSDSEGAAVPIVGDDFGFVGVDFDDMLRDRIISHAAVRTCCLGVEWADWKFALAGAWLEEVIGLFGEYLELVL